MELPRLQKGVLYIGEEILSLKKCNLDRLIEAFGYPESYGYSLLDPHYVVFLFQHELGLISAYLYFEQEHQPMVLEIDGYAPGLDRGQLAELQIELHEYIAIKRLGEPRKIFENKRFKFILFAGKMLGRLFYEEEMDAICFFNPKIIRDFSKTFLYRLSFWPDAKLTSGQILSLQLELNKLEEEEVSKK